MRLCFVLLWVLPPVLLAAEDKRAESHPSAATLAAKLAEMRAEAEAETAVKNDSQPAAAEGSGAESKGKSANAPTMKPPPGAPPKKRQLTLETLKDFFADEKGRITTDWVDAASTQGLFDRYFNSGYTAVLVEHKVERSQGFYRFAFKDQSETWPGVRTAHWYCYSGLRKETFEQRNNELLKGGYVLMHKQVSDGEDGESCICAIWVKPPSAPKR